MNQLIQAQKKLLPDLLLVMQKRFEILQYIRLTEPIGRRSLSASLGISERVLRSEVQFLKEQNLVDIKTNGMTLTEEGYELLSVLEDTMKDVLGLTLLEKTLKERLNLKDVIIVSGDSDQSPWVKKEMGRAAVACMKKRFSGKNIFAVTGGTTIEAVVCACKRRFMRRRKKPGEHHMRAYGGKGFRHLPAFVCSGTAVTRRLFIYY
jgi:central glycolytic genes regulator